MVYPLQLVLLLAASNLPILQAVHQDAAVSSLLYASPLFQGSRDREQIPLNGPHRKHLEPDSERIVNLQQSCHGSRLDWPLCDFNSLQNSQSLSAVAFSPYANVQGLLSYATEEEPRSEGKQAHTRFLRTKRHLLKTEQNAEQDKLNSRFKRDAVAGVMNDLLLPWVAEEPFQVTLLPLQEVAERQEKRSPRFSPWGGKRSDFEIIPVNKRSVIVPNYSSKRDQLFSSWGGKRAFSSWGGKREKILLDDDIKRAPKFSSWEGKRGTIMMDSEGVLTPTFSSWGGKRDSPTIDEGDKRGQKFSSWGGKRDDILSKEDKRAAQFSSWGGKRDSATEIEDDKRAMKFSSWGGKRDGAVMPEEGKRAMKFSSWGGKRDDTAVDEGKRAMKFSSWGGKRDDTVVDEGKRAMKFSSWGGKRDDTAVDEGKRAMKFSSWGGKRDDTVVDEVKRAMKFSSWGGKRYSDLITDGDKRALKFSSWGGKRQSNVMDETDIRFPVLLSWNKGKYQTAEGKGDKRTPKILEWTVNGDETLQEEDKRAAKFSNWGGKRDPTYADWDEKETVVNNSWGKENVTNDDRAGKVTNSRLEVESNQELNSASIVPELPHSPDEKEEHENVQAREKRAKFSSWGGKRTGEPLGDPEEVPEDASVQKRDVEFRTWKGFPFEGAGGKRALRAGRFRTRQINSPPLRQNRRGADFYPWGGKRSDLLFFD